jgi:hypothetical protein
MVRARRGRSNTAARADEGSLSDAESILDS